MFHDDKPQERKSRNYKVLYGAKLLSNLVGILRPNRIEVSRENFAPIFLLEYHILFSHSLVYVSICNVSEQNIEHQIGLEVEQTNFPLAKTCSCRVI